MNAILKHFIWLSFLLHYTCAPPRKAPLPQYGISLLVLGVAQDGGYPHAGCRRDCCLRVWSVSYTHLTLPTSDLV